MIIWNSHNFGAIFVHLTMFFSKTFHSLNYLLWFGRLGRSNINQKLNSFVNHFNVYILSFKRFSQNYKKGPNRFLISTATDKALKRAPPKHKLHTHLTKISLLFPWILNKLHVLRQNMLLKQILSGGWQTASSRKISCCKLKTNHHRHNECQQCRKLIWAA